MTIRFGSGTAVLSSDWTTFKASVLELGLAVRYAEDGETTTAFAFDSPALAYVCRLWATVPESVVASGYTQAQNDADKADFEANFKKNLPIDRRNKDRVPVVSAEPRLGTEVVYATHNFADRTTWFGESVRVTGEEVSSVGGLVYDLAQPNVIDMVHGKVFDELQYVEDQQVANPGDPHGYAVVVKVDGVPKTPRTPFATSGGDYTVDYVLGKITFFESQLGHTVTVDYSYAAGSAFLIAPDAGFALDIESAKAEWSDDFVMSDAVLFEAWGLASVFAPQLGLPEGTKIPLDVTRYESMGQFLSEAISYVDVPAAGGAARGFVVGRHAAIFRYGTVRRIAASGGLELRIRLPSDTPMQGSYASATFYCTRRSE